MIQALLEFLRTLTTPERLIHLLSTVLTGWYGYAALCGIVFSETGLLIGFFLPGDSLLFTVGVVAGAGQLNIVAINVLLMISAVAGNATGYSLGSVPFVRRHFEKAIILIIFLSLLPIVAEYAKSRLRKKTA